MTTSGSARSRWTPADEAAIQAAIDQGLLAESHFLDFKRELGTSAGERKDFARHLASFAIDGGDLIIGVEEDKANRTWRRAPQPLDGLPERVDQLAGQLVDPPLFVSVREIPSSDDPARGYLVVHVPASPVAPHMVDGVYYGRGERTRQRLSDAEVVRLHSRREPVERLAVTALDEEVARDHVNPGHRQRGHLYAVALPLTARPGLARELLDQSTLAELLRAAEPDVPKQVREFAPAPGIASQYSRRAQGAAMHSYTAGGPGRTLVRRGTGRNEEESLLDVEFREDGGIRLLMGRMTADWSRGKDIHVIADGLAVAYALRLVRWAGELGQRAGYHGTWILGIHADGLRGLTSSVFLDSGGWHGAGVHYDADDYREVTTAAHLEVVERPEAIAERLVGRLLRGLGSDGMYGPLLTADATHVD